MNKCAVLLCSLLISVAKAQQYPVTLGDTRVVIVCEKKGPGQTFVHLHQNETTALKAARAVVQRRGGQIMTLTHPGGRNIVFNLHHVRYEFDPNRIFSDIGIKKTLTQFGAYSFEAHVEVKQLSDKIKMLLPAGMIIAVHNNEDYSLNDYRPQHTLAKEARALYINKHQSTRNFYFVTQKKDYKRLQQMKMNSVWQTAGVTDDGSLSVFLAHSRYINVEAGYDQLVAQRHMLERLV